MGTLLDETVTWADFGRRHLDRRISKALTKTLGLERPTLVQSRGIPVALEGKDLLCRARTGSGKTLCYAVPLIQRLLADSEAGSLTPLRGIVLVPTKELIAQVHSVIVSLLTFCFDVLSAASLLSGEKYVKAELPTILVTTPSSVFSLVTQRQGAMQPLASTLKVLVIDEADLMFSFGYEDDMRAMCALMPSTYQAMLFSATLSEEVEQLKGLMLHKPVVLKLEEPRITGKLSQFYLRCHKDDKYLILYTLLKLQLVQGKILMFVESVVAAYRMKIFLERFSINCAVLNAELPHNTRQEIIQAFNQSVVELLIATDSGFKEDFDKDDDEDNSDDALEEAEEDSEEEGEEDAPEQNPRPKKKAKKSKQATATETVENAEKGEETKKKKRKLKKKAKKSEVAETEADEAEESKQAEDVNNEDEAADEDAEEAAEDADMESPVVRLEVVRSADKEAGKRFGRRRKTSADEQYSLSRGVDLKGVSTVINADMPASVRDYAHRVGRCARGGASGTALTLSTAEEELRLQKIVQYQASTPNGLQELPLQMGDVERFRYRVEDMARGLTKKVVMQYRARELQLEALNSEKLKEYFEDHPEDKKALQKAQRQLRERKSVRQHLRSVPYYLVPEQFAAMTPVQKAVHDEATASGGRVSSAVKRKRILHAKSQDPLQSFGAKPGKAKRKRRDMFTREAMEAKERRIDPKTANVEELPPISSRKLWKLKHGKRVRKKTDAVGERKRMTMGQKKRFKKFGF